MPRPTPILYSFRRCPYAMRARLAIVSAGIRCELREIVLRDKAPAFVEVSPKATVPVIVTGDSILEESLDIMFWALDRNDPQGWKRHCDADLIAQNDGPFKCALDRTKYANRHPDSDPAEARRQAHEFMAKLEARLSQKTHLSGPTFGVTDAAIAPFVRQFAFIDKPLFDAQPWPSLQRWLSQFLASKAFADIMHKYPKWQHGDTPIWFPA